MIEDQPGPVLHRLVAQRATEVAAHRDRLLVEPIDVVVGVGDLVDPRSFDAEQQGQLVAAHQAFHDREHRHMDTRLRLILQKERGAAAFMMKRGADGCIRWN